MEKENKTSQEKKKEKITSVFTLTEKAVKEWWKHLDKFIGIYLWGLLFSLIPLVIVIGVNLLFRLLGYSSANIGLMIISVVGGIVAIYFYIRTYMALFLLVKEGYRGKELDIFRSTYRQFWPYLGLVLLTTVFVLLWSLLLIIPGIIFSILYSLVVYVYFFEGKRGMKAIKRSVRLVKGYWWPVFGRFLFLGIILWLFTVIISTPMYVAAKDSVFYVLWNAIVQIISFLIGPISLLFTYYIYKDLVKIKK